MTLRAVRLASGPGVHDWLLDRCRSVREGDGDPLAPVTVVVPTHAMGLQLRRRLAADGYANIRFLTLADLADLLAAPALAGDGLRRLTDTTAEAAVRGAAQANRDRFGDASDHRALVDHLRRLFGDLRELGVPPPERAELSQAGPMAWAALAAYEAYRVDLASRRLADEQDVLGAAARRVEPAGRDVGHLLAFVDGRLLPAEIRLLQALAAAVPVDVALPELGDSEADGIAAANASALGLEWGELPFEGVRHEPAIHVTVAPDAAEEVRMAVRGVLSGLEAGTPLAATAILYRLSDPYAALVRETLDAAEVPWASLDGRPLASSHAGRGLLGLLRLRESGFARVEVLTWLNTFPRGARDEVSVADWDRISREAEIVAGVEQWRTRLEHHVRTLQAGLRDVQAEQASEGLQDYLDQTVQRAQRMADLIERLERDTRPPPESTWPALVGWARGLRAAWVRPSGSWGEREREAAGMVDGVLDGLAAAGDRSSEVDVATFLDALEAALGTERQPEGRLGSGVVVGPVGGARGMAFERVHVVGATEQAFPVPPSPDPLFASGAETADPLGRRERRRLDERRQFCSALAAAPAVGLSAPLFDDGLRPVYPSRWVVELASRLERAPVRATALRELPERPWLTRILSPSDALQRGLPPLNLAERRAGELLAFEGAVTEHPLARRGDLPLGRALSAAAARWSARFTEFDGNVAGAVEGSRLEDGLAGRPASPTGVEEWAECPFRYLLSRVLRVEPTERPEQDLAWSVSALVRGRLVHDVLREFYDERLTLARPGQHDAQDHERLEALARDRFTELEVGGGTGHRLAWENEQRALLLDLHTLLARDAELHPDLVPTFFEQSFGYGDADWPAPVIVLEAGREVRLRGRMDRVDLGPDPAQPEQAIVIDYKTGAPLARSALAVDPLAEGTSVQPAVYQAALRAHFEALGLAPPLVTARYWFVSARGRFEVVEPPEGLDVEGRLREVVSIADAAFRAGSFPAIPGDDAADWRGRGSWEHCARCSYTRVCHAARDLLWQRKRAGEAGELRERLRLDGG